MQTLQFLFIVLVILVLCYLLTNGLLTRSVWVKGSRRGIVSFREWAHKRSRDDEPLSYWFAIVFYSAVLLCLAWLLNKST